MRVLILVFAIASCSLLKVAAQSNSPAIVSPTVPAFVAPQQDALAASQQENAALQRELKITETYDGNLLKTVHWTLTTVFTLFVVLVGYNWWTSHKIFERDRQRFKEEILNDAKNNLFEVRSEFATKLQLATTSLEEKALSFKHEVSSLATQLNANAEQRNIQFADDLTKRLEAHRIEIDSAIRNILNKEMPELEKRSQENTKSLRVEMAEGIESFRAELKFQINMIGIELYGAFGEKELEQNRFDLASWYFIMMLDRATDESWEARISDALKSLIKCYENGVTISDWDKSVITRVGSKIPPKLTASYEKLKAMVLKAPATKK